jgi:hypothetical protein
MIRNLLDHPNIEAALAECAEGATESERFFLLFTIALDMMRRARDQIAAGEGEAARKMLAEFLEPFDQMETPKPRASVIPATTPEH